LWLDIIFKMKITETYIIERKIHKIIVIALDNNTEIEISKWIYENQNEELGGTEPHTKADQKIIKKLSPADQTQLWELVQSISLSEK